MRGLLILIALALMTSACAAHANLENSLRKRAAFDLNCPAEQIQTTELDQLHWGAQGCGRRSSYLTTTPNCVGESYCIWKAEMASEASPGK